VVPKIFFVEFGGYFLPHLQRMFAKKTICNRKVNYGQSVILIDGPVKNVTLKISSVDSLKVIYLHAKLTMQVSIKVSVAYIG